MIYIYIYLWWKPWQWQVFININPCKSITLPETNTAPYSIWKWMVGIPVSFWDGLFFRCFVSFTECKCNCFPNAHFFLQWQACLHRLKFREKSIGKYTPHGSYRHGKHVQKKAKIKASEDDWQRGGWFQWYWLPTSCSLECQVFTVFGGRCNCWSSVLESLSMICLFWPDFRMFFAHFPYRLETFHYPGTQCMVYLPTFG